MCGINAVISGKDNKSGFFDLYESLYHLQHRGQDSFGISYLDYQLKIETLKYNTLLSSTKLERKIKPIQMGIGHVRYPTSGEVTINECQPFYLEGEYNNISLVHNGQIWITESLKEFFYCNHIIIPPDNTSDSIYLVCLLSYFLNKYEILTNDIIVSVVNEIQDLVQGSYNCICLIHNLGLICFKDEHSIRPLIYGQNKDDKSFIIASESVSITSIGYEIIDDIYGNDLLIFNRNNNKSILDKRILSSNSEFRPCIFEWVYLAREESILYNVNIYQARLKMGEYLAHKIKDEIDISKIDYVVPVPDTSKPVALSVSKILGIPYYECITKNRYVNRTFIMNTQEERGKNIKRKLNIIPHFIQNKNLLIIDDSIVRGNTMKHIIKLLKDNDSNEIYVASSCPEIINKNVYGIDIPDKNELISYTLTNDEICREFNVNHIIFQNLSDLKKSIQYFNKNIDDFEDSIFTT